MPNAEPSKCDNYRTVFGPRQMTVPFWGFKNTDGPFHKIVDQIILCATFIGAGENHQFPFDKEEALLHTLDSWWPIYEHRKLFLSKKSLISCQLFVVQMIDLLLLLFTGT
mmetsp:Transcript_10154/g.14909  ORF Transcript_10154/g.14909 Transcript_10154/m.14909 type:complete len:110 (-) Transcript_10154:942-1271(-)